MWRKLALIPFAAILFFATVGASSCEEPSKTSTDQIKQRQAAVQDRVDTYASAASAVPFDGSQLTNFPMRDALVDYTLRQDLKDHPWYIYIMGDSGNTIGYFVGKTYPQSTCNFLSSSQITDSNSTGRVVLVAPSYDGIFYGGGGASGGGCDYFFFDAATDAMQVISNNWKWFVSDAPLKITAEPIKVN